MIHCSVLRRRLHIGLMIPLSTRCINFKYPVLYFLLVPIASWSWKPKTDR